MTNLRQMGFIDRIHPVSALINISETHELLRLAKVIPWPEQIEIAMNCRASKVKALVGPEPHYRELLGAVALTSVLLKKALNQDDCQKPVNNRSK